MVFQSQTDEEAERMNVSMEHYLRIFTSHQQDDWVQWLPLTEFAVNNETCETTKCSAFFAVTGMDPQMTFEEMAEEPKDSRMIDANQVQAVMQQVYEHL
jgi:hypothetical protein